MLTRSTAHLRIKMRLIVADLLWIQGSLSAFTNATDEIYQKKPTKETVANNNGGHLGRLTIGNAKTMTASNIRRLNGHGSILYCPNATRKTPHRNSPSLNVEKLLQIMACPRYNFYADDTAPLPPTTNHSTSCFRWIIEKCKVDFLTLPVNY